MINIKNLKVKVVDNLNFYAGGDCLGFSLRSKGTIIVGGNYILTNDGKKNPFKDSGLKIGDVIIKFNEKNITNIKELQIEIKNYETNNPATITVLRKINNSYVEETVEIIVKSKEA